MVWATDPPFERGNSVSDASKDQQDEQPHVHVTGNLARLFGRRFARCFPLELPLGGKTGFPIASADMLAEPIRRFVAHDPVGPRAKSRLGIEPTNVPGNDEQIREIRGTDRLGQ